ncbi:MAG: hypothetical protein FD138_2312 [Planctomycetota bacterium]|nr:MAG: hypothetical protein FD138_2312 [Planctomycetota bacterium]
MDKPATKVTPVKTKSAEPTAATPKSNGSPSDVKTTAAEVDRLINEQLAESKVAPAGLVNDEDFLRRVHFDIAGTIPTAKEVTLFGLDPDPNKRAKIVEQLLGSDEYALNWARYWRDVLFLRATNERARVMARTFEDWMVKQLQADAGWDDITRSLITGKGEISEHGETALIFIHEGNPEEIAGEVSRIFLGIQMQCANCHDHPTDKWTRDQFHSLAAFFPRITLQREPNNPAGFTIASFDGQGGPGGRPQLAQLLENAEFVFQRNDTNRDGKLSKAEAENSFLGRPFDRLVEQGDNDKDGQLTIKEIKNMPQPPMQPGRGKSEHHMPDLKQPNAEGKLMTPALFTTNVKGRVGMDDEDRRELLGKWITSPTNTWFAKSLVNRLWGELLGEGFYMPIDDLGPERKPRMVAALDYLSAEFVKHDHDLRWLLQTIAATNAYQRQIRYNEPTENPVPFASAVPVRLRSDQIFNAIIKVLGIDEGPRGFDGPQGRGRRTLRGQFEEKFGYDPSTPQDEILGNVPQALALMNLPQLTNALRADGNTRLGQILANNKDDSDAIAELYLSFLARDPSKKELTIATEYLAKVGNRREAFEDLAWSLLNSSEFISKR